MTTRLCHDCKKECEVENLEVTQVSPFTTIEVCWDCKKNYNRRTIVYPQEVKVWVREGSEYDAIYKSGDTVSGWYKKEREDTRKMGDDE